MQAIKSDTYDTEYFLKSCQGHEQFVLSGGRDLSPRMRRALELAGISAGKRVLDVGAGRGELLYHAARAGAFAVGIDYSPAAVKIAHRALSLTSGSGKGTADVLEADACAMPFPEAAFDVVLMLDIVEHLFPRQLDAALSEARRVLKPGGRLIVHTAPNALVHRVAYPVFRAFHAIVMRNSLPHSLDEFNPVNVQVHVNKQTTWSLRRSLRRKFAQSRVWLEDPDPTSALLTPDRRERRRWAQVALRLARCRYPMKWFCCNHIFAVAER